MHAVAATVSLQKTITIVSLYLHPDIPVSKESLQNLFDQLPKPFLVLGDYNAHSPTWGDSRQDGRGTLIETLTQENNLIILNGKEHTFFHSSHHTYSAIDLAVSSPSTALDFRWAVHDDLCGSDHFPIFLTYKSNETENSEKQFNFNKANWSLFRDLCETSIKITILETDCPATTFTENVLKAATNSIPSYTNSKNRVRVPWFTADCRDAIKNRKKAQRRYVNNPTTANVINYKRTKAKCKYVIRQAKKSSWQTYVSSLNTNTSTKSVWKKIRKIKGKESTPNTHLKRNNRLITDKKEHANRLAQSFEETSSTKNYSKNFQKIKQTKEKTKINFSSDNCENYNKPFTILELKDSLKKSNQSAAGPDGISYQFLTHLPETCLKILLDIFNSIWDTGILPASWKEATVIPIPKPNKDTSDPKSYRPIALTSCLCKTLERMVNSRLIWVLETKNLISKYQCGFRENHSTQDDLVRFETFVREAFARKKQVLAVFFDLEKAYDTTWKHGILSDLYNHEFRGKLPIFIQNFLSDRHFKVKSGSQYSDSYCQENGVPQGSILSPILFNLKINNIMKYVSSNANASLYVDDFALYIEGKHLQHLERTMQLCINKVQKWVSENGFKFSVSKTTCVHFHRQRIYKEPLLKLGEENIPVQEEVKFLGLIFDKKLSFKPHIVALKRKCQKALNILRVVGHTDWGADRETLLKLYRTLIRSKLDYGCTVYGSAKKSNLKLLDPIHHQGLRIALGAFRTSPVTSLYAESGEPSLEHRRLKLSLNYTAKLNSTPENPCYDSLSNSSSAEFFKTKKTDPALGARIENHFQNMDVNVKNIDSEKVRKPPPWEQYKVNFDTSLTEFDKGSTNALVFQKEFSNVKEKYNDHYEIYTDGSKQDHRAAAAFYLPRDPEYSSLARLKDNSSVFSAELEAILMALKTIKSKLTKRSKKFALYVDSLPVLQALQKRNYKIKNVRRIFNIIRSLSTRVSLTFIWTPAHVGISGNENVDKLAKTALTKHQNRNLLLNWADIKPVINKHINALWQHKWNAEVNNKYHHILPDLKEKLPNKTNPNRKQETVMSRLRIGHTWLTHSYLLKQEHAPFCFACDSLYTVRHILVECSDFADTRRKYYSTNDMGKLFREVDPSKLTEYLKEIGIYNRI